MFLIKKNELYGFIFIKEVVSDSQKTFEFKIIEPKFKKYLFSNRYTDYKSNTYIFEVYDYNNLKYYINNDGIEFKQ